MTLIKFSNRIWSKAVFTGCILAGMGASTYCMAAESALPLKDARTQKILGNQFRCGAYYYDTRTSSTPVEEVEREVNRMADMGFNYVYSAVSVSADPGAVYPQLDKLLEVCARRGMAVRIQAGGRAYLRSSLVNRTAWKKGWDAKRLADIAVPFIKRYMAHPNVIDILVMEEPGPSELKPLREYYQEIFKQLPDAPIMILYNRLEVSQADKDNLYPRATGSDIYPFRGAGPAKVSGIRSPGAALEYYSSRMNAFQQLAQQRGQSFEAVFSSFAVKRFEMSPEDLRKSYYGTKDEAERQAAFERDLRQAKAGNRGFSLTQDGKIQQWFRYWAPPRYMTTLSWLSLAQGADSMAVYAWAGTSRRTTTKGRVLSLQMLDDERKSTRGLDEFAAFAKQIRPFGKLMRSVSRDAVPFVTPKDGDDTVETPPSANAILHGLPQDVVWNAFSVPRYRGKMVVLVNTLAGTWSEGKSPVQLQENHLFRINDSGELIDFMPITQKCIVECKLNAVRSDVFDLFTGQKIPVNARGELKLEMEPGSGRILFLAPTGSDEAQKLMQEYELPSAGK